MLVTDLNINNEDISRTIKVIRQQNPQLIRRQQAEADTQQKSGISERLKGYLQKIQGRQQLGV